MKGPMAATITAGAQINAADLKKPLYIVITADEEVSGGGARQGRRGVRILQSGTPQAWCHRRADTIDTCLRSQGGRAGLRNRERTGGAYEHR